jgi:putative transposase
MGARNPVSKLDFDLWAFVFMPEHAHLVVHPRRAEYAVSAILQGIKEPVAREGMAYIRAHAPDWLSRLAVTSGGRIRHRFWQAGGGYDRNIIQPATLLATIDYVHMNPIRRNLAERPEHWKWSSAAWFAGVGDSPIPLDRIPPEWLG